MLNDVLAQTSPLQIVGLLGAALYVVNYMLLTMRRIDPSKTPYFVLNLLAASFVLFSLSHAFNAAAMVIQTFWIAISLYGIVIRIRRAPAPARPTRLQPLSGASSFVVGQR